MLAPSYILTYVPKWPLILNLLGAIACLGLSFYYHSCRCISSDMFHKLICMDKSGISLLIAGAVQPMITYIYACDDVATVQ